MKKILIIEDDEVIRENTADFLNGEGYVSYTAGNGIIGIQMAREILPDLILCDVVLPKLNGSQVLQTLQDFPQTAAIPVIFVTAGRKADNQVLNKIPQSFLCLFKPFTFDELLSAIQKAIIS
ncbi:MAG: response regulator [Bacteroidia bacterium]|nr:response regulator [Bacteroidia bacterium]